MEVTQSLSAGLHASGVFTGGRPRLPAWSHSRDLESPLLRS